MTATPGTTPSKNGFKIYSRISYATKPVQSTNLSKNLLKTKYVMPAMNSKYLPSWPRFSIIRKTWSFHVVVWQRTATKCTKIYNTRAQLLFCSLNLLFSDVPVAVAVMVCLSSLTNTTATAGTTPGKN